LREDLGGEEIVYLEVNGTPITTVIRHDAHAIPTEDQTTISLDPKDLALFAPDGARVGQGETPPGGVGPLPQVGGESERGRWPEGPEGAGHV
jgi:hypothetical protein